MNSAAIAKSIRSVGVYFFNLTVAIIGTSMAEDPFDHFVHFAGRTKAAILKGDCLTAATAFVLGYFVYYKWRWMSAKWIWIAGVSWFGLRALGVLHGPPGTLLWEVSKNPLALDMDVFTEWSQYTVPLLRTIAYSAGAVCCYRFGLALKREQSQGQFDEAVRGRDE